MKHYKLHELIEMARSGKKFKATKYNISPIWTKSDVFLNVNVYTNWNNHDVLTDWKVEFLPEIIEFDLDCTVLSPTSAVYEAINDLSRENYNKLDAKKWRVVCTEMIDEKERGL